MTSDRAEPAIGVLIFENTVSDEITIDETTILLDANWFVYVTQGTHSYETLKRYTETEDTVLPLLPEHVITVIELSTVRLREVYTFSTENGCDVVDQLLGHPRSDISSSSCSCRSHFVEYSAKSDIMLDVENTPIESTRVN